MAIAALVAAAGCSAVVRVHECDVDADCKAQSAPVYCSDDHLCVDAVPAERLCAVSVPAGGVVPAGALVVGGLYRTSGASSVNDHLLRQAADLAAEQFVAAGYNVAHVVCDTAGDPAQAARAYVAVIERYGARVVVGPDASSEVVAIAQTIQSAGVPIVSPSATSAAIGGLVDGNLVWRTSSSDNLQAKVLATLVPATAQVEVAYESDDAYAVGLMHAFAASYPGTPRAVVGYGSQDASAIGVAAATLAADHPAFAVLLADLSAPSLLSSIAAASGSSTTQMLMPDAARTSTLWSQLGDHSVLARVRGTGPSNPEPTSPSGAAFAAMAAQYRAAFGEDAAEEPFVANAYDAFYVAALAALALPADERTPSRIAANLARVSDPGGTAIAVGTTDLAKGVSALAAGPIDLVGTSGPIDFDANGDVVSAPIEVWSIDASGASPTFKTDAIVTP